MKKKFSIIIFILLLFLPLRAASENHTRMIITEIAAFETSDAEWIEIQNEGTGTIEFTGWKFFEDGTNHGINAVTGDNVLEPGEIAVIANKIESFQAKYPAYSGALFDSSWGSLKQEGEEIGLKDAEGNFTDLFTYPQTGKTSLERIDATTWLPHPTGHSMGTRQIAAAEPAPIEIPVENPAQEETAPAILPTDNNQNSNPTETLPCETPLPTEETEDALPPEESAPIPAPAPETPPPPAEAIHSAGAGSTSIAMTTAAPKTTKTKKAIAKPAKQKKPPPKKLKTYTENRPAFFPEALLELRGYFVFVPQNAGASFSQQKKPRARPKTERNKTPSKTEAFRNGSKSESVKITELFPNAGDEEEWIEIFNAGPSPVNLGNWTLADTAKQSSPFKIPDTVALQPGGYRIFPKSETKIALNNSADEIFLADFEGQPIHSVSYEKTERDHSYAWIEIQWNPDFVASAGPIPARTKEIWEWISDPTPGAPNPKHETLSGTVARLLAGSGNGGTFEVKLPDGITKNISFSQETIDPLLAELTIKEGAAITLEAKPQSDGSYELKKINEIQKTPQEEKPHTQSPWLIASIIFVGMCITLPLLIIVLRIFARARAPAQEALSSSLNLLLSSRASPAAWRTQGTGSADQLHPSPPSLQK